MRVERFSEGHLEQAATLLARVQMAGSSSPAPWVGEPAEAARVIGSNIDDGLALAAVEGAELCGFLIVTLPDDPVRVRVSDVHHAADPDRSRGVYRALYQVASAELVRRDCFEHRLLVLAHPAGPAVTLAEMGFGIDQIKGIRPIPQDASASQLALVGPAVPDELEDLVDLWIELARFHARPPMLEPPALSLLAIVSDLQAMMADERRVLLVARQSGRPVGMIEAHRDTRYKDTVTIGLNVVTEPARSNGVGTTLLDAVMGWGTKADFGYCAVGWASANPLSDSFYRTRGFVPVRYELVRRIDSRFGWAESLDDAARRTSEPFGSS